MEPAAVFDRLDPLLPVIRRRRAEIERARRMPRDLVDDLAGTGMFRLSVPRALGGLEADPATILRIIERVAAADGSTGWCAMVGIANNLSAGYMHEEGAREVFGDGRVPSAGIASPAGRAVGEEGGVRVSGRWSFASGITHSDWVWAGCMMMADGQPRMTDAGPDIVHVCIPVAEVELNDTWHVSGLCGTGSIDFTATDVFVPGRRIFRLLDPAGHRSEPLFQLPPLGWFVSQLAAVSLGIARTALDEVCHMAQSKTPTLSMNVLADRPAAQLDIARAETALGAARTFLYATVDDLWSAARADRPPTAREIALNRAAAANAAETGAAIARTAGVLGGGGSIHASSSLQRHVRDADALAHHFTVAPHVWEDAGRVLLGREPASAVF